MECRYLVKYNYQKGILLCDAEICDTFDMQFLKEKTKRVQRKEPLSEDTLRAIEELGAVLARMVVRLRDKGYDMINGELVKVSDSPISHENEKPKNG